MSLYTIISTFESVFFFLFFNCDSLHARLNNHYEAWSYKKRRKKSLQDTENLFRKNLQLKMSVNSGLKVTKIIGQRKAFYR